MSALSDAIAALRTQVENLRLASSTERVAELEGLLQAEREAAAALAASEEAEDVTQNQELADARAATDALVAEMNSAASDLGTITDQLAAVGTAVDDAPDDTPVGEVPVEDVPAPEVPAEDAPASPPATDPEPAPTVDTPAAPGEDVPTEDAPGDVPTPGPGGTAPDAGVSPDGGAPADAGPAPADQGTGPVDASGNPVEGPNI